MGMFLDCAIGDLGDEAQRALGTDHQMLEDFEGVFVIHQGVEAVTAGVLDLELVADASGQCRIGAGASPEFGKLGE